MKFSNSPFISQFNYVTTLNDLIETFYYFKNETLDEISDDELIFTENEKEWQNRLRCFLGEIDFTRRERIKEMADKIKANLKTRIEKTINHKHVSKEQKCKNAEQQRKTAE